jgi:hypothetical protein
MMNASSATTSVATSYQEAQEQSRRENLNGRVLGYSSAQPQLRLALSWRQIPVQRLYTSNWLPGSLLSIRSLKHELTDNHSTPEVREVNHLASLIFWIAARCMPITGFFVE